MENLLKPWRNNHGSFFPHIKAWKMISNCFDLHSHGCFCLRFQGTFEWSRTMSKKKGQKWGMNGSNKKNGNSMEANHHFMDCKITENVSCAVSNQKDDESNNIDTSSVKIIEEKFNGEPLDFERFYPLTRLPKVFQSLEFG